MKKSPAKNVSVKKQPAAAAVKSTTSSSKNASPPAATLSEAQRQAATILEVLAGLRSPPEAAEALAISLPRYYQLEARALAGLVNGLAPRPHGKQPSLEKRIAQLEKELAAAERACARQAALVRTTQRTLGLVQTAAPKTSPPERDRAGRKKRRPTVRALKAAEQLRTRADSNTESATAESATAENIAPSPAAAIQTEDGGLQPAALAEEVPPCTH